MNPHARRLLAQVGSFALAGVLLYFAFRGADLKAIGNALVKANYAWLLPLIVVMLGSHWLRAWRWQVLIEGLPHDRTGEEADIALESPSAEAAASASTHPTVKQAFYSVMIGYMVNYAAPRLGEVARTANLSVQAGIGFSHLFGTVVVERILDMVVLVAALGSVFFLLLDRMATLDRLFIAPLAEQIGSFPTLIVGVAIVMLGLALAYMARRMVLRQDSTAGRFWSERARPAMMAFNEGLLSLLRVRRWGVMVFTTISIWLLYLLAAYMPFEMLGMAAPFQIDLLDAWSIMILGAIGVAIPSPGGTGSYHYITVQTLVHLFALPHEAAATYAVLTHGAQLVLYVVVGVICLALQGTSLDTLRRRTLTVEEGRRA